MRSINYILALSFLFCSAALGGNAEDPPYTVITIPVNEKDKLQKYLTFDVEMNGKKINALYDTGSPNPARILKTSAARIGIPPEGGKFDVTIGKIVLKDVPVRCVDKFNTNYPRDIIFGNGLINRLYTVVDYPSCRALFVAVDPNVTYADADRLARKEFGEPAEEFTLPLVSPEGHILVETTFPGKEKMHFVVDTGWLGFNILTTRGTQVLGVSEKFTKLDFAVDGHEFKKVLFKNTRVAALEGSIATFKKKGLTFGGILGVPDFLGHYRIGIDYKELKLHVGTAKKAE